MKKDHVQVQATITGVRTLADGGMSVTIATQELPSEQKFDLIELHNAFGWVLFRPSEQSFTTDEIPSDDPEQFDEVKSPSQRLRAVIFKYWGQKGKEGDFNQFYRAAMEKHIQAYKNKLN